jgi:hypothetical protein
MSLTIGACSIYKSGGRKNFESAPKDAPITAQDFKPIQCDDISTVSYWYETRITSPNSQWIESLPNLEVWEDQLDGQEIQIRTFEKHNDQQTMATITRCQATFSSVRDWVKYRSFYLSSLEEKSPE